MRARHGRAGRVVAGHRGRRPGDVPSQRLLPPLGITEVAFTRRADGKARAAIH